MAGAAASQEDEDRLGVPDGPEAPARVRGASGGASGVRGPQLDELVGAYPNYNEEEEERRYYRRKRLGVLKNVLAASAGGMLTYGVPAGTRGRPSRSQPGRGNRNRGPPPPARSHFPSAALAAAAADAHGGSGVGVPARASACVGGGLRDRPAAFGTGGRRSQAGRGLGSVTRGAGRRRGAARDPSLFWGRCQRGCLWGWSSLRGLPGSRLHALRVASPGLLQMQLILHYDETYREVKYGNMGLPDIDSKMLMGINVTPIAALLYTPVLIRWARLTRGTLRHPNCGGVRRPVGPEAPTPGPVTVTDAEGVFLTDRSVAGQVPLEVYPSPEPCRYVERKYRKPEDTRSGVWPDQPPWPDWAFILSLNKPLLLSLCDPFPDPEKTKLPN
ncbi:hypothetical protein P7K49_021371 [Saguinus oedipus]|uniref:Uncharacterized protein n=1 Tax=Saguinus oedipus TaxID=9490 RepID=A0ABQ9USI2_SAGOE|nr:hypothetical protein P7K49_021371 [Saguinus oedipus]